jgi:hypothetical protein
MNIQGQRSWVVFALIIMLLAATGGVAVQADGYVIPEPMPSSSIMADQKAVLIYREGREDLVISIGLDLRSMESQPEMAWIIPVPSQPEVRITDNRLFDELDRISAPEITWKAERRGGFSWSLGAEAMPQAVEVLERKQVGIYDVAVLSSTEADALLTWLHEEGFQIPDALMAPLEDYIAEGWTFVAMRIAPGADYSAMYNADPVWLSFDAERMVYPMRLTAAHGEPLALRLYVLADHRYELDGFTVEFAGKSQVEPPDLAMSAVFDREYFFTKLFNESVAPAEMDVDFYPYQAATDEPYREQVVHTYYAAGGPSSLLELLCPCGLCWLGLVFLLIVLLVAIALLKRRKR